MSLSLRIPGLHLVGELLGGRCEIPWRSPVSLCATGDVRCTPHRQTLPLAGAGKHTVTVNVRRISLSEYHLLREVFPHYSPLISIEELYIKKAVGKEAYIGAQAFGRVLSGCAHVLLYEYRQ